MLRIPVIVILICGIISLSHAQDSTHSAKPVKPVVINKTYKYRSSKYYVPKTDSSAGSQAPQRTAPLRHDSVAAQALPADKSLNGQYQYLLGQLYHYQQPAVSVFWKSVSDTLNINRRKLNAAQTKVVAQGKTIDSLKADAANKNQAVTKADRTTILGITLSKTTYNFIVWGLVLLFGITAVVVIARSAGYSREAKYRVKLYEELEEDFKAYKTKANDKEIKLARELQTERNKLDELLGRG
jgi:hypothetical protein